MQKLRNNLCYDESFYYSIGKHEYKDNFRLTKFLLTFGAVHLDFIHVYLCYILVYFLSYFCTGLHIEMKTLFVAVLVVAAYLGGSSAAVGKRQVTACCSRPPPITYRSQTVVCILNQPTTIMRLPIAANYVPLCVHISANCLY